MSDARAMDERWMRGRRLRGLLINILNVCPLKRWDASAHAPPATCICALAALSCDEIHVP